MALCPRDREFAEDIVYRFYGPESLIEVGGSTHHYGRATILDYLAGRFKPYGFHFVNFIVPKPGTDEPAESALRQDLPKAE